MKRITLFSILAVFVAALSFTSCNTDSEDTRLTLEQQTSYQNAMQGSHSGWLYYPKKNEADVKHQQDSVRVTWFNTARDSSMTLQGFPVSVLAEHITNAELKEAVAKAPAQTLNFKVEVYNVQNNIFWYMLYPMTMTTNLTYGGADHKVQWVFYLNNYSIGAFNITTKLMQNQFYLYGIWVDDKQTDFLKNNVVGSDGQQTNVIPFFMTTTK